MERVLVSVSVSQHVGPQQAAFSFSDGFAMMFVPL
jgi:hypothetical protein